MKIQRFYGIDTWRAALLIFGVMAHCAEVNKVNGKLSIFTLIIFMSHAFRMEAFFAVSGFLAAFALKKDPTHFIISRFRIIAIPLAVVLGVIMPPLGFAGSSLHHLWFLVTLLGASWLAYSLEQAGIIDRCLIATKGCTGYQLLMIFLIGSNLASVACYILLDLFTKTGSVSDVHSLVGTLLQSPYYCVFYFAGLYISRSVTVREKLLNVNLMRIGLASMCLVSLLFVQYYETLLNAKHDMVSGLITASLVSLSAAAMAVIVIGTGLSSSKPRGLIMRFSAASYTIYLLHFPIIAGINHVVRKLDMNEFERFGILFILTSAVSFFIHEQILRRSPMLRLLLNGRGGLSETAVYKTLIKSLDHLMAKLTSSNPSKSQSY